MTALPPTEASVRLGPGILQTAPTRISVLAPADLSEAQISAWRRLQGDSLLLGSPYLTPEYLRITAAVRAGVAVAVAEAGGVPVGFLPFERHARGIGKPVGGPLCDVQAVIADPGWDWDARDLVRAAGLQVLDFTHLRADQRPFTAFHRSVTESHVIDLGRGFEEYVRERRAARVEGGGTGLPHHAPARLRKLQRDVGEVRFEHHDPDPRTLHLLLRWKSRHYSRTGSPDAFAHRWCVDLIERIHAQQGEHLSGMLSTLSAGGRIIAAHMGMRSRNVWHWWFPSYDPAYAAYSPGFLLLVEVCRHAAQAGIRFIELGAGGESYKLKMSNASIPEAAGFVGLPSVPALLRRLRDGSLDLAARLPIGPAAEWPARALCRYERIMRYR